MRMSCAIAAWVWVAPAAGAPALRVGLRTTQQRVGRFERIEFELPTNASASNPCDPGEIDLRVELTAPSGRKLAIPAFCYQPCLRQQRPRGAKLAEWVYPVGPAAWKARFAPAEAGAWSAAAALETRGGSARSRAVRFECVPSRSKGFVRVSRRDPRFFELDDGSCFFPVGQNVAFVYDAFHVAGVLRKLGRSGANLARVWVCCEDWALAVEARKSGWGRSWSWHPPIVHAPGREGFHGDDRCVGLRGEAGAVLAFSPTRPIALRPGTKYRLSGLARTDTGAGFVLQLGARGGEKTLPCAKGKWTRFGHDFTAAETQWWLDRLTFRALATCTMYLRDLSLREAGGGPELLGEADANRPMLGVYNQIDCFLLDRLVEAAEQHGVYLQLVLLTRDHYMPLLKADPSRAYDRAVAFAKRLARYVVARWGYSTHIAAWEYFNEMNEHLPTERLYRELGEHLRRVGPYRHLRTTSAWASPSSDFGHRHLDLANMHWYMRPAKPEHWRDAAAGVLAQASLARQVAPRRPVLLSEFGMTTNDWKRPPEMDKDRDFTHLHNALWASALSGLSGTACHWFWDDVDKKDMYHHYGPVAAFVGDIPYASAKLRPAAASGSAPLRVVGLQSSTAAYLWVADPRATWWHVHVKGARPAEIKGASVKVGGLGPGAYRIEWWDTRRGKVFQRGTARASNGALRLTAPRFTRDLACKVLRAVGAALPERRSE